MKDCVDRRMKLQLRFLCVGGSGNLCGSSRGTKLESLLPNQRNGGLLFKFPNYCLSIRPLVMLKASDKPAPDFNPGNHTAIGWASCRDAGTDLCANISSVPTGRIFCDERFPGLKSGAPMLDAFSIFLSSETTFRKPD